MCAPLAIAAASFAVSAAGQIAGYVGQNDAAKKNKDAALTALQQDLTALDAKSSQEQVQTLAEKNQAGRQLAQMAALSKVHSAIGGVAGASVDEVAQKSTFEKGQADARTDYNLQLEQEQIQRERAGAQAGYQSRVNAVPGGSALGLGISLFGDALNFAGTTQQRKP